MRINRAQWVWLMPYIVLAAMLALTAGIVAVRARAVTEARITAVEAAEGHFWDVVADNEDRGLVASNAYERVLVGAALGLDSPVSIADVEQRLDALASDQLPGSLALLAIPVGQEPVWIDGVIPPMVRIESVEPGAQGLWVAPIDLERDLVAVGYTTGGGDMIASVVSTSNLLDLSTPVPGHRHVVAVTVNPLGLPDQTPVEFAADMTAMADDAAGNQGAADGEPMVMSDHGDTAEHTTDTDHPFAANRELTMFGQPWAIDVVAGDGFLSIPSSREVGILAGLGTLLSLSLFGLIYFLVRRLAAETRGREAEERFAAGFDSSPIGFAVLDEDGAIIEVNASLERLLERDAPKLTGMMMAELVAEPDRTQWRTRVLRQEGNAVHPRAEVRYETESGRTVWVDETVTTTAAGEGEHHLLLQMSDISEQRHARDELSRRALHDELTGLANRTLLEDRLEQALRRSQRDESIAAIIFIDIDQFKTVNDTLGHKAGDQLLITLAERLHDMTRAHDTIARFGGDEFIMLCENLQSQAGAWQIAERIQAQVAEPITVDDRSISITLSIGIALCRPDDDPEALLRDADLAMYRAKELGRDRAVLFEREMRDDLIQRLALEDDLVGAIARDELELFYQPLLRIADGQITGFEALARWNHPKLGLLTPDKFLPVAAQLGLLPAIDAWALDTAARQLIVWTAEMSEASSWTVAVNASPGNFGNPMYPDAVRNTIAEAGIEPKRVTIEITEDAILTNTVTAVDIIGQLRRLGLRVAIDDFGTGYSSLSQLATLEIDILKIDKSFLADLQQSPSNEIVRAVVDMAQALGIPTVAEGVETSQDLELLHEIGATEAQGYLIARPMPSDQVRVLATEHAAGALQAIGFDPLSAGQG